MSSAPKEVILYFYTSPTTFIRRDLKMLEKKFIVKGFSFYHKSKWYTPILFLKEFLFMLWHSSDAILFFCRFAGYHSFLPALWSKISGKPFVIILGGTESVSIPSIQYGVLNKGLIGRFVKWSFRLTPVFAPVHQSLIFTENLYFEEAGRYQGIKHYIPNLKANFITIPNGYDPVFFKRKNVERINNSFITVAFDLHRPSLFQLKGIDLIVEIAPYFPHCQFTIVGLTRPPLKEYPSNIIIIPPVNQEELILQFSKHEFYFQLSLSEGFPNALCEAMLCNCIPVVSNVTSMPEIVGNSGFILEKRDVGLLKKLIEEKILQSDKAVLGERARKRISENYSLAQREKSFVTLIENLK